MVEAEVKAQAPVTVSIGQRPGIGMGIGTAPSGTLDYNALHHKPRINSVELTGDRQLPEEALTNSEILEIWR